MRGIAKLAIMTREEHFKAINDLDVKLRRLSKLRGFSPTEGVPADHVRLNNPVMGPSRSPNAPLGSAVADSPLREAEVIKAHNPYADSTVKRLKHRWANPVKRFMKTRPGKFLGLGALGTAAGLGAYSYLSGQKTPQAEQYLQPSYSPYAGYSPKMGAMTGPSTIPTPPPLPRVSVPGPAVGNLPTIKRGPVATPGKDFKAMSPAASASNSVSKMPKMAEIDSGIAALLAGGVGGGAGYYAGKHIISPLIEKREEAILKELAERTKRLEYMRTLRKYTPMGIAALGAVALASLAASRARSDERNRMAYNAGHFQTYDPTRAGFGTADNVPVGSPYEDIYG